MPQSLAKVIVHIVYSTKSRKPWLDKTIRTDLFAYNASILASSMDCLLGSPLRGSGGWVDRYPGLRNARSSRCSTLG